MNSSFVCACKILPGPNTIDGIPFSVKEDASQPKSTPFIAELPIILSQLDIAVFTMI